MWREARVTDTVQETPTVWTIYFSVDGGVMPCVAGQYVTVAFDGSSSARGKAYSLSSAPGDDHHSITVKQVGHFSRRITSLTAGDRFFVSQPYGFFNVNDDRPLVAVVAGVGISPVWSIIRDVLSIDPKRSIHLLMTAPTKSDLVFYSAIDDLKRTYDTFSVDYFVTQEKSSIGTWRRLSVAQDISDHELCAARFYICGSQAFVTDLWRQFVAAGVDESAVVTEVFFEATQL